MSDKAILVHIGYNKTGTSWLQSYLFGQTLLGFYPLGLMEDNEFNLGEKRLPGDKRLPKKFAHYFIRDGLQLLSPFEDRTDEIRALIHNLNIPDGKVGVLSSERLSGGMYYGGLDSRYIADRLHIALPEAKILICIREQCSMILSSYFHYLRIKHECVSLYDFIQQSNNLSKLGFSMKHFCYDELIAYYQKLFGVDQVLVLPYELFKFRPQEFVDSVTNYCDLESVENLTYSKKKNSLGINYKIGMYYSRHFNIISDNSYYHRLLEEVSKVVGKILPSRFIDQKMNHMKQLVKSEVGDYYTDSNRRTSELIGCDLAELYGYK